VQYHATVNCDIVADCYLVYFLRVIRPQREAALREKVTPPTNAGDFVTHIMIINVKAHVNS
jgi:hypothetical protein